MTRSRDSIDARDLQRSGWMDFTGGNSTAFGDHAPLGNPDGMANG